MPSSLLAGFEQLRRQFDARCADRLWHVWLTDPTEALIAEITSDLISEPTAACFGSDCDMLEGLHADLTEEERMEERVWYSRFFTEEDNTRGHQDYVQFELDAKRAFDLWRLVPARIRDTLCPTRERCMPSTATMTDATNWMKVVYALRKRTIPQLRVDRMVAAPGTLCCFRENDKQHPVSPMECHRMEGILSPTEGNITHVWLLRDSVYVASALVVAAISMKLAVLRQDTEFDSARSGGDASPSPIALTPDDRSLMIQLAKAGTTLTQEKLAGSLNRDTKTVRAILKGLEKAELVEYPRGRKKGVTLTHQGKTVVRSAGELDTAT